MVFYPQENKVHQSLLHRILNNIGNNSRDASLIGESHLLSKGLTSIDPNEKDSTCFAIPVQHELKRHKPMSFSALDHTPHYLKQNETINEPNNLHELIDATIRRIISVDVSNSDHVKQRLFVSQGKIYVRLSRLDVFCVSSDLRDKSERLLKMISRYMAKITQTSSNIKEFLQVEYLCSCLYHLIGEKDKLLRKARSLNLSPSNSPVEGVSFTTEVLDDLKVLLVDTLILVAQGLVSLPSADRPTNSPGDVWLAPDLVTSPLLSILLPLSLACVPISLSFPLISPVSENLLRSDDPSITLLTLAASYDEDDYDTTVVSMETDNTKLISLQSEYSFDAEGLPSIDNRKDKVLLGSNLAEETDLPLGSADAIFELVSRLDSELQQPSSFHTVSDKPVTNV
ncbi:unnamed protein product [Protopolystoma xenopodis]|uniref:Uncharacterized protein n=1 Tax=Protopolystoma xenopodis TaxID=117903 RepID=A0A3S5BBZ9_9PLAT|nr:unnamed protein product [Protopolystoma xenopodis]